MAGGLAGSRKTLSGKARSKQRNRDNPTVSDRRRPLDPPWRPEDDYLLIQSVFVTSNLSEVHACVRFSNPYTEAEIEQRWRLLLFNSLVSATSREAIANMPAAVKSRLDAYTPFSCEEDNLLTSIPYSAVFGPSATNKYLPFEQILSEHPTVFYSTRTPAHLLAQWNRLRSCHLIAEEPSGGEQYSFSDTELLMEEIVTRDLNSGLSHLQEPSAVARRRRQASTDDSYHGFQATVSQTVADHLRTSACNIQQTPHRRASVSAAAATTTGALASSRGVRGLSRSPSWAGGGGGGRSEAVPPEQQQLSDSSNSGNEDSVSQRLFYNPSVAMETPSLLIAGSTTEPFAEVLTILQSLGRSAIATTGDGEAQAERHRYRRRLQAKMSRVEEEARRWTALVESEVANGFLIHDHQPSFPTLATLTGRRSRFLIKCKSVTFGRSATNFSPDVDLSCEGEASRISRRHGNICLADDGVFWLSNLSKHAVLVDGNPVLKYDSCRLYDKSIVCVSHMLLRFDVEHERLGMLATLSTTTDTGASLGGLFQPPAHRSAASSSFSSVDGIFGPAAKRPRKCHAQDSNPDPQQHHHHHQ